MRRTFQLGLVVCGGHEVGGRVLRKLEGTLKNVKQSSASSVEPVDASAAADLMPPTPTRPVDKKSLMREMLLGEDATQRNASRRPSVFPR